MLLVDIINLEFWNKFSKTSNLKNHFTFLFRIDSTHKLHTKHKIHTNCSLRTFWWLKTEDTICQHGSSKFWLFQFYFSNHLHFLQQTETTTTTTTPTKTLNFEMSKWWMGRWRIIFYGKCMMYQWRNCGSVLKITKRRPHMLLVNYLCCDVERRTRHWTRLRIKNWVATGWFIIVGS